MTEATVEVLTGDCRDILPLPCTVVVTDPPYAVDKRGEMLGQLATNYHEKGTHTRGYADHDPKQYEALMVPSFDAIWRSLPQGGLMVSFAGTRTFHELTYHAATVGFDIIDVLVFPKRKTFARATSTLVPCHELAFFARKPGGAAKQINPNRNIGNVFDLNRPQKSESEHPTTKAQVWMEEVIRVFTTPDDVVLDPFAGSGSTLIAARAQQRSAIGIEVIPEYADLARRRLGLPTEEQVA